MERRFENPVEAADALTTKPSLDTSFNEIADIINDKTVFRWKYGAHDLFFIFKEFFTGRTMT